MDDSENPPAEDWDCVEYKEEEKALWRNENNDCKILVTSEGFDSWVVTGENSVLYGYDEPIESSEEAVGMAIDWMRDHRRPSGRV